LLSISESNDVMVVVNALTVHESLNYIGVQSAKLWCGWNENRHLLTPFKKQLTSAWLLTTVSVAARHDGAETQLVFARGNERADHALIIVWRAVVDYIQPEVVATLVHVAAEIAEVLHQDKGRVVLTDLLDFRVTRIARIRWVFQVRNFDHIAQDESATATGIHGCDFL